VIDTLDSKNINSHGFRVTYNTYDKEKYRNVGDGGIDIFGQHKLFDLVAQCKFKTNDKVKPTEIRDFIGATSNKNENTVCLFVTNSGYTRKAITTANSINRKIYLTTTKEEDDHYINKVLDEIINEKIKNDQKNNFLYKLDTDENSETSINNNSIIIKGKCTIEFNLSNKL